MIDAAVGKLTEAMGESVDVLRALSASESESVRLRASDRLLSHSIRIVEVEELQRRVAELESLIHKGDVGLTLEALKQKLQERGVDVYGLSRGQPPDTGEQRIVRAHAPDTFTTSG